MAINRETWEQGYDLPCTAETFAHIQELVRERLAADPDTAFTAAELVSRLELASRDSHDLSEMDEDHLVFATRKALDELAAENVVAGRTVETPRDVDVYYRYLPEFERDSVPY